MASTSAHLSLRCRVPLYKASSLTFNLNTSRASPHPTRKHSTFASSVTRAPVNRTRFATMATNGHTNGASSDLNLTLYTNHGCPFAHRVHITLAELGVPVNEEVSIDLGSPRPQWYLDINPRGLVPSIKFASGGKEAILTESAIVAQFLIDAYPSHLFPEATGVAAALSRARINFFVDTWNTKVQSAWFGVMTTADEAEKATKVDEWVAAITKEIEPLLTDAKPFFGGSSSLTFAEVIVAPFLLRWYALAKDGELIPTSLIEKLDALPNFAKWSAEVRKHPSANQVFDEEAIVAGAKKRMAVMRAKKA